MAEKSENKNADIFDFPKLDCNEKQNGNPYVSFIVRQCKWPSLLRKIAEIQKYCYHGNLTSQRPQNSPIMQFVTKSTQSHAQFLNGNRYSCWDLSTLTPGTSRFPKWRWHIAKREDPGDKVEELLSILFFGGTLRNDQAELFDADRGNSSHDTV